jgi:hypothetical protein
MDGFYRFLPVCVAVEAVADVLHNLSALTKSCKIREGNLPRGLTSWEICEG